MLHAPLFPHHPKILSQMAAAKPCVQESLIPSSVLISHWNILKLGITKLQVGGILFLP